MDTGKRSALGRIGDYVLVVYFVLVMLPAMIVVDLVQRIRHWLDPARNEYPVEW